MMNFARFRVFDLKFDSGHSHITKRAFNNDENFLYLLIFSKFIL